MNEPLSPVSFLSHRQAEFTLVADLARLRAAAASLGMEELAERIEHARSCIANHRFSIAVVGEFKRGKSTFINALLGKEVLPADIAPTSATINRVTYGLKPAVRIVFRDSSEEQMVDIGHLGDYVTKLTPEAETMASKVKEAIVYYPAHFCKQNVDIIDTPGLADDVAMTEVTMGVLPRVDAAILVILATSPFSQTEAGCLKKLLLEYSLGSVLFVVTAIDRLHRASDRERILSTVRARIQERIREHAVAHFGTDTEACQEYLRRAGDPRVFGISGYNALAGKIEGDEELLADSRFPEFEEFLERFLTEESGLVALKTHTERISWFATTLRREVEGRLACPTLASEGPPQESIEALLRSVEWLALDAKNRLEEHRREAKAEMRSRLQVLTHVLHQAGETSLADITVTADDLETPHLPVYVRNCCAKVAEARNAAAVAGAAEFVGGLRSRIRAAVAGLLQFAIVFDRVMLHICAPPGPPPESMSRRIGGTNGFDRAAAVEGAVPVLFEAHAETRRAAIADLLMTSPGWGNGIEILPMAASGPKFARKAVDLIRTEKFKIDLRGKLIEAVSRHLQETWSVREQALDQQVAEAFAVLARQIERALEEIGNQRSRLQAERQRGVVWQEHERQRLAQLELEIQSIDDRAKASAKQFNAAEFGGLPQPAAVAGPQEPGSATT